MNVKGRDWIDFNDAVGLTIESVADSCNSDALLVGLSGGKFAMIRAEAYEDDASIEYDKRDRFYSGCFSQANQALVFGEPAAAQWQAEYLEQLKAVREKQEIEDRKIYERLKAKFEPQQS